MHGVGLFKRIIEKIRVSFLMKLQVVEQLLYEKETSTQKFSFELHERLPTSFFIESLWTATYERFEQ